MTVHRIDTLPCGTSEIELLVGLYGELEGPSQRSLEEHARACAACAAWMAAGRDTFDLLRASGLREMATDESPGSWPDLRAALAAGSRKATPVFPWWRLAQAAAVLLLAGASFTVGRLWDQAAGMFSGPDAAAALPGAAGATGLDSDGRLLLFSQRTNDYLDRSRMVLLELANGDFGAEGLSLSEASRRLLQENPAARPVAREIADRRLQDLVEELEVLLGQISRLPQTESGHVERIRTYLNNSGLLEQLELMGAAPRLASDRRRT
jgi:hypothetical protein